MVTEKCIDSSLGFLMFPACAFCYSRPGFADTSAARIRCTRTLVSQSRRPNWQGTGNRQFRGSMEARVGTASGSDCVVIGAAIGYGPAQVQAFVGSLFGTGFSGRLALIVDQKQLGEFESAFPNPHVDLVAARAWRPPMANYHKSRLRRYLVWNAIETLGWLLQRGARLVSPRSVARHVSVLALFQKPHFTRFVIARDYLASHSYTRVLLSDVRDVVFQSDPFEALPQSGLCVGIETDKYTLGSEYWNSRWMRSTYGQEQLRAVADNPVSCSGVTFGDGESMRTYLDAMIAEFLTMPLPACWLGCDQAPHNFLLWTGTIGQAEQMRPLESPIATLNAIEPDELEIRGGLLRNRDGDVASIVHMYDRLPGLTERLSATS